MLTFASGLEGSTHPLQVACNDSAVVAGGVVVRTVGAEDGTGIGSAVCVVTGTAGTSVTCALTAMALRSKGSKIIFGTKDRSNLSIVVKLFFYFVFCRIAS